MPRDIRSYFTSAAKNGTSNSISKAKKRAVISSDEDDVKTQSPVKRSKLTKKSSKHHVLSDSDDDTINQKTANVSKLLQSEDKKPSNTTTLADIFGTKPMQRAEAPKITKKVQEKEAKIHKDDDFEATLNQLDTSKIEEKYLSEQSKDEKHDSKNTSSNTKKLKTDSNSSKVKHKENKSTLDTSGEKEMHEARNKKKSESSSEEHNTSDNSKQQVYDKKRHAQRKKSSKSSNEDIQDTYKNDSDISKKTERKKSKVNSKNISKLEIELTKITKKDSPEKPLVDMYEKRIEKRKHSTALYQQYLQRGGARNPGSKVIPTGAQNCLAGLSFLITGVLDSLEREEADELIKKYGGRILQQVSRKTDYVIVGDEPGPSKMSKATSLNIKKISEDDLLEMIRTRPAGKVEDIKHSQPRNRSKPKSSDSENISSPSPKKVKDDIQKTPESHVSLPSSKKIKIDTQEASESKQVSLSSPKEIKTDTQKAPEPRHVLSCLTEKEHKPDTKKVLESKEKITTNIETEALVEKYRPKTMKQILGQHGDKSNAKKLYNWLMNWHKNQSGSVKHVKPNPWTKNDDGGFFKAALLSGPPGIGKTTTVQVVCKELDFDLVEFNASDTRSKKLLKEEVSELLSNTTIKDYFNDSKKKPTSNHVLLMDEVDGMAGNEDRGGLQELINLIKSTDIPIVCICNDRNNPKMRTLANYTFDLRFQKPRLEQIRGAMKSICYKESIQISTEDLDRLIESTNQDIRQVINHLALLVGTSAHQKQTEKKHENKDLKLGPWDVVRQVFSVEEHKKMDIHGKSELFFHDYSIAPLFVQENYLLVNPQAPRSELLRRIAEAAESLALGDIVEKSIRSNGSWSLLPVQACYSSVIPGTVMSGHITSQINFPCWLGRNSKRNKFDRLTQEITVHTRLTTGVSKEAINLDYLTPLRNAIVRPLVSDSTEGIEKAINVMNTYHLMREDLDSLIELSLWPGQRDPMQSVDSKVKAAFTRTYNKNSAAAPYVMNTSTAKKKSVQASQDEGFIEGENEEELNSDEDEDNVDVDRMIKAKKPSVNKKTESTSKANEKPAKRGRGRGRGK